MPSKRKINIEKFHIAAKPQSFNIQHSTFNIPFPTFISIASQVVL